MGLQRAILLTIIPITLAPGLALVFTGVDNLRYALKPREKPGRFRAEINEQIQRGFRFVFIADKYGGGTGVLGVDKGMGDKAALAKCP